jgi:flagellin-like protein
MTSRRAVAPVIATLLLVAIAVVGGSIIFVFSQGFFSSAQISGSPQIESIKILGYDSTDGNSMVYHDGVTMTNATSGADDSLGLKAGEYIGVYVKNDSVNKVTFSEIRLAGNVFEYKDLAGAELPDYNADGATDLNDGEYSIVVVGYDTVANEEGVTISASAAELQPGEQATIVMELDKDIKSGRDLQFKLTTASGSVFVGTINSGQQSG